MKAAKAGLGTFAATKLHFRKVPPIKYVKKFARLLPHLEELRVDGSKQLNAGPLSEACATALLENYPPKLRTLELRRGAPHGGESPLSQLATLAQAWEVSVSFYA